MIYPQCKTKPQRPLVGNHWGYRLSTGTLIVSRATRGAVLPPMEYLLSHSQDYTRQGCCQNLRQRLSMSYGAWTRKVEGQGTFYTQKGCLSPATYSANVSGRCPALSHPCSTR